MVPYKGKGKCGFCHGADGPRRARWRSSTRLACHEHRDKIEQDSDPKEDPGRMTEADYQTWFRL